MNLQMMEKLHTLGFPLVEVMPYQLVTQWPSFILAGKKLYFPKTEALLSELTYFSFTIIHKTNGLFYVIDRGELATDSWFDSIEVALADYYIRKKSNDNKK